jgi:hydroxyacylglutathione hydrolase
MFTGQNNTYDISAIPALKNNYIWILHSTSDAYIVDPGDPVPVLDFLRRHQLQPHAILVTHRHADHIGGISGILREFSIPVIGPQEIDAITHAVDEGDTYTLHAFNRHLQILKIPGHTSEHIAYWCPQDQRLFSGDTLFSAGCGRVLGGTPEQLYSSLQRIADLPDTTQIYASHEYTQANLRFALSLEPENPLLIAALADCQQLPTLPTNLLRERQINPFLRCQDPLLRKAIEAITGKTFTTPLALFIFLRQQKDIFQ